MAKSWWWLINVQVDYVDGTTGNFDAWVMAPDDVEAERRALKKAKREALNADETTGFSVSGVHVQYGTGSRLWFNSRSPYWAKGERSAEIVSVDTQGDMKAKLDASGQLVKIPAPGSKSGYSYSFLDPNDRAESNPRQRELAARLATGDI